MSPNQEFLNSYDNPKPVLSSPVYDLTVRFLAEPEPNIFQHNTLVYRSRELSEFTLIVSRYYHASARFHPATRLTDVLANLYSPRGISVVRTIGGLALVTFVVTLSDYRQPSLFQDVPLVPQQPD